MSEEKFTKGPWIAAWGGGSRKIISADGDVLMSNEKYYPWNPKSGHDWNLIASAPEMYEMLESVKRELYMLIDEVNDQRSHQVNSVSETPPDMHDNETLYLIDKLLAKARGES